MSELPFPDVRSNIIPDTLLYVKTFVYKPIICEDEPGPDADDLAQARPIDDQISAWVDATGNLIVVPGALTCDAHGVQSLSVTYIKAVSNNYDRQEQAKQPAPRPITDVPAATKAVQVPAVMEQNIGGASGAPVSTAWLSDGGGRRPGGS